jgi:formate/nitrite transporter
MASAVCGAAALLGSRCVTPEQEERMAFKSPPEITAASIEVGAAKSRMPWDKALVGGFLAGAYIAFASLLAVTVSAGMDPKLWGGVVTLFTGAVFTLGLVLVVIAGSELLTGNMALVPLAAMARRTSLPRLGFNWTVVLVGNLAGSLFVAYFLAVKTGVVTTDPSLARLGKIALLKGTTETDWQIFLRAMGCNWLVCLAVWMAIAAEDVGGKVLAIFFPIMAFVAMGFDHVVANMFFLPAAIFAHVPGIGWGDTIKNWIFAFLGNMVGAGVFVAGAYYYLYGRAGGEASAGGVTATTPAAATPGDGRGDLATAAPSSRTTA